MINKLKPLVPAIFLTLCSGVAMAGSVETLICLKNETNERKLILIEDIDNYDWDGFSRPDHNWNGTYVEAGNKRCESAKVNAHASTPSFSFVLRDSSRSYKIRMSYKIFQMRGDELRFWSVLVGDDPSRSPLRGDQSTIQKNGWEAGGPYIYREEYNFKIVDVP